MERACICESSFVWFVGVMSTKHVSNYMSIWGTVMMECRKCLETLVILLVRIRGFSLLVHRNKEYEAMRLIRVTSVLRKIRNA
jgi:hypothetical protein